MEIDICCILGLYKLFVPRENVVTKKNTQVKADGFLSYPLYIGLFIKIEKDAF